MTQVKPKVHRVHICFWNPSLMTNSEARHKVAHSTVSYTKQPIVCLTNFAQGGNTSVEMNGLCKRVFHRGASQRSHYSFDPVGSAQWVTQRNSTSKIFWMDNMVRFKETGEVSLCALKWQTPVHLRGKWVILPVCWQLTNVMESRTASSWPCLVTVGDRKRD